MRPNEISAATGAVRTMSEGPYRCSLSRESGTRYITEETALVSRTSTLERPRHAVASRRKNLVQPILERAFELAPVTKREAFVREKVFGPFGASLVDVSLTRSND